MAPDGLRNTQLSPALGTTTFDEEEERHFESPMSLDRTPSPQAEGGWSSPGLTAPYDESNGRMRGSSPGKRYGELNGPKPQVSWASAKANSARVNGYPSYQSQNQGFFARSMRRMSSSLPYFHHGGQEDRYAEKEKLGRGRSWSRIQWQELPRRVGLLVARRRKYVAVLLLLVLTIALFFNKCEIDTIRRNAVVVHFC